MHALLVELDAHRLAREEFEKATGIKVNFIRFSFEVILTPPPALIGRHHLSTLRKQFVYTVIRSFADAEAEQLFRTGRSHRLPTEILRRAQMRLRQLDAATRLGDLKFPPSNRLEQLLGDRRGRWSIRINEQWRICFKFEEGHAHEVEIVDYH